MDIRKIRGELSRGRPLRELPLRVTFYARVSTDKTEQQGSLENQIQYYTDLIRATPCWTFAEGYVDEGISGTTALRRESFLRMIADARGGKFDFILTKEISRFSRSTLDSIRYTQELLEAGVGVLFQNDNINTLDADSEFRLVVMAGVAQDEVRKLSERLKFGFRQSIQNGRVLGNDRLWGYSKKDCRLTVVPEQAEAVRTLFTLYATGRYGIRTLSRELTRRGFTSREGNPFNPGTIGHILTNPKYKGWYCGHRTQSVSYRTHKKIALDSSEWVTYPDPRIPAIVPEALWDAANALYQERSRRARARGEGCQSRYPYSGKLLCGVHNAPLHRQSYRTKAGTAEFWKCRVAREQGKDACGLPGIRTAEVDAVLAELAARVLPDRERLADLALRSLREGAASGGREGLAARLAQLAARRERLLELRVEGALSLSEFRRRDDRLREQAAALQSCPGQAEDGLDSPSRAAELRRVLGEELRFSGASASAVLGALLDRAVLEPSSTRECLRLRVCLRQGGEWTAEIRRRPFSVCCRPA
jgi:DNA invertase Pin-like site-specific DNA recombinase